MPKNGPPVKTKKADDDKSRKKNRKNEKKRKETWEFQQNRGPRKESSKKLCGLKQGEQESVTKKAKRGLNLPEARHSSNIRH